MFIGQYSGADYFPLPSILSYFKKNVAFYVKVINKKAEGMAPSALALLYSVHTILNAVSAFLSHC